MKHEVSRVRAGRFTAQCGERRRGFRVQIPQIINQKS
jgi:hypothetical protein